MAAGGELDAGDFAGDPDVLEIVIEERADGGVDFGDGEDLAFGEEGERKLFQRVSIDGHGT